MAITMRKRLIAELTSPEIPKHIQQSSILCLPIGSIEQHGPHLPLNTDVVLAEAFTQCIIDRWSEQFDLWQLPTMMLGLAREHQWAPGTLSLTIEEMVGLVRGLGREVAHGLPTRNLAIINGHGGNRGILEAVARDLRADFSFNVCVMHPTVWTESQTSGVIPDIHGGKNETSIMLAIAPDLVRLDQIPHQPNATAAVIQSTIADRAVTWPWTTADSEISKMGIIGDATAASTELGERLLEQIATNAGPVLQQLLDRQSHECRSN